MLTPVHIQEKSTYHETGVVLSADERGQRSAGYHERWLAADQRYDVTRCADRGFAAHWLACLLAGFDLPATRREVDLGIAEWSTPRAKVRARMVGIIGPTELRVVFRWGYASGVMCLPEEAVAAPWESSGPRTHEADHDAHGRVSFAGRAYAIPADIIACIEEFYRGEPTAAP